MVSNPFMNVPQGPRIDKTPSLIQREKGLSMSWVNPNFLFTKCETVTVICLFNLSTVQLLNINKVFHLPSYSRVILSRPSISTQLGHKLRSPDIDADKCFFNCSFWRQPRKMPYFIVLETSSSKPSNMKYYIRQVSSLQQDSFFVMTRSG